MCAPLSADSAHQATDAGKPVTWRRGVTAHALWGHYSRGSFTGTGQRLLVGPGSVLRCGRAGLRLCLGKERGDQERLGK